MINLAAFLFLLGILASWWCKVSQRHNNRLLYGMMQVKEPRWIRPFLVFSALGLALYVLAHFVPKLQ